MDFAATRPRLEFRFSVVDAAIALTKRFLKVHGDEWDVECEVRQMEGPDFGNA